MRNAPRDGLMRSLLFVRALCQDDAKATASGPDVLIFDLGRGSPRQQAGGRQLVRRRSPTALAAPCAVRPGQRARQRMVCRDLEAVMPARPDGIMLPKLVDRRPATAR